MKSTFYVNVCICNEVATLFDRVTQIHAYRENVILLMRNHALLFSS